MKHVLAPIKPETDPLPPEKKRKARPNSISLLQLQNIQIIGN